MSKTKTQIKALKIADTNTILPDSGKAFMNFFAPSYDGTAMTFYGNNSDYEGIYYAGAEINAKQSPSLVKISDNHTAIPDLNGPPTTNTMYNLDAYVAYNAGYLSPCSQSVLSARPMALNGGVAFFAANWNTQRVGIFAYDAKSNKVSTLVSNTKGEFQQCQFSQPTAMGSTVYFSGVGKTLEPIGKLTPPQGVFSIPLSGAGSDPTQVLDASVVAFDSNLFNSFGTSHSANGKEIYLYGLYADKKTTLAVDGIFSYSTVAKDLKRVVPVGQKFGDWTIPHYGAWAQCSVAGDIVAFQTSVNPGSFPALFASVKGQPTLIQVGNGNIPGGGGQFDGNAFATPPVTDGKYVAYSGLYSTTGGFGENAGLFVWNSATGVSSPVLLANDPLDGKQFFNIALTTSSFVNGWLAALITFTDGSSGVYLLDLSSF